MDCRDFSRLPKIGWEVWHPGPEFCPCIRGIDLELESLTEALAATKARQATLVGQFQREQAAVAGDRVARADSVRDVQLVSVAHSGQQAKWELGNV